MIEKSLDSHNIETPEQPKSCTFCDFELGTERVSTILKTPKVHAFVALEKYPLVIPRRHIDDIFDRSLDSETAGELLMMASFMANLLKDHFGADGINIVSANGEVAGQEIKHLHIHIIPRQIGVRRSKTGEVYPRQELDDYATKLREKISEIGYPFESK